MVVLFTSSVILIGFDGMINDIFAFEISISPGYGGGWSCCYRYRSTKNVKELSVFIQSHAQVNVICKSIFEKKIEL